MHELYKLDTNGGVRVWWVEVDGNKIRNVSGLLDGEKVESGWKLMKAKNVGKVNETTPEQQAIAEANALYEKKLNRGGYHTSIDDIQTKKYIEPMLAKTYEDVLPIKFPAYSQPKLDGHRCIATKNGLFTRKGQQYVSVPHVEVALLPLFQLYPDLILDGELYNHDYRDNFNEISSCVRKTKPTQQDIEQSLKIQYHIYDIVDTKLEFDQRNIWLVNNIYPSDVLKLVRTVMVQNQIELDREYNWLLENGYEGQIIRYNGVYEIKKRSKFLIKRKEFITEEFEIDDIIEGEGNWAGYAKSVNYRMPDDRIASAGIRGTQEFTRKLLQEKKKYIGNHSDVTIRYFQKTPDGIPRFGVAIEFFEGKRNI